MNSIIFGIDFNDYNTLLTVYSIEDKWVVPTVISKTDDEWLIGKNAYESLLSAKGVLTDKLFSFLEKDKNTTIFGHSYSSVELVSHFFNEVIKDAVSRFDTPDCIVVAVPIINNEVCARIKAAFSMIGFDENTVRVISKSEAFIYYTMSQNQEIRNNNVGMFSLEDNTLTYYELKVSRKAKSYFVYADSEIMDESFNLDVIENDAGAKLGDKILSSCASRLLKNKVFSAIIITGKGFENQAWAPDFMKIICNRRKVFYDDEVFSRGAGYRGADIISPNPIFSFTAICEGRIDSSIFLNITKKDSVLSYPLISIGDPWYYSDKELNIIPFSTKTLDMSIVPMEERQRRNIRIPLDFLPKRPDKTTLVKLTVHFVNAHNITITLKDQGFGELFPASDSTFIQEVSLWD